MAETQGASANAVATKKIRVDIGRPKMTVLQILTIAAFAGLFGGCAQKSEVDKCVDAWEATVKGIPEDVAIPLFDRDGKQKWTLKSTTRYEQRLLCMRAAGKAND
jgi:hypothetical protein